MDSIWFLFIFVAVVLLSYLMFSGCPSDQAPKAGANEEVFFNMPPQPVEPMYNEVGDDSEMHADL